MTADSVAAVAVAGAVAEADSVQARKLVLTLEAKLKRSKQAVVLVIGIMEVTLSQRLLPRTSLLQLVRSVNVTALANQATSA